VANNKKCDNVLSLAGDDVADSAKGGPRKNTVAAVRREVHALGESMAEIDKRLDTLMAAVARLEAVTAGLAVEVEGELSPVAVSTLYKDVDVLKQLTKLLVARTKKNGGRVRQISEEAERLKAKYPRWL